jgi:hypothetical protein
VGTERDPASRSTTSAARQVDGLAGAGDQILQVRQRRLAHGGRPGQQAELPHPGAHLVEAVAAPLEQPPVDQVAQPALGGGQRDAAAPGDLGQAEHPVLGVEGVEQAERPKRHGLARCGACDRQRNHLRRQVPYLILSLVERHSRSTEWAAPQS